MSSTRVAVRGTEQGFALIMALLALMLLTFLGLTLAFSTSTELQIATNYRWSQQALYNAEAGLEYVKTLLPTAQWSLLLPPARTNTSQKPVPYLQRPGEGGEPNRDFEMYDCDSGPDPAKGNQGLGLVYDSGTLAFPLQNVDDILGQQLNGTFTVWVRRPVEWDGARYVDHAEDDTMVITVEGTAPYRTGATTFTIQNRAVRYMEATMTMLDPSGCENLAGQQGAGPGGMGFDQCSAVEWQGVPGATGEPNPTAQ